MDIQDVSGDARYGGYFKQIQEMAAQAGRRKGQKPPRYAPASEMVFSFMANVRMSQNMAAARNTHQVATTQIPASYPPCTLPVDALRPVMIADMLLETHHRGKRVALRVLTPPDRMTAIMAIVEDERGTASLLQLYHQPSSSLVPTEHIIYQQRVCIVKEPFLKMATNGSLSIRVDHVGDVVWLGDSDSLVPVKWRTPGPARRLEDGSGSSSHVTRMQGNKAVQNQEWSAAERLYSVALSAAKTPEEETLARLNRSLANIRLGRLHEALDDARQAGRDSTVAEKAMFREARALYELGAFGESLDLFEKLVVRFPTNSSVAPEIERARSRVHEQKTGDYSFRTMLRQAQAPVPVIDCATFREPVEVRVAGKAGRGLFTVRSVKAGDLLVCEKAFGYVYAGSDQELGRQNTLILMGVESKTMTVGGQAHLITQVVQKLANNLPGSAGFKDLYHGDYDKVCDAPPSDGKPIVDTFLAAQIIKLNCFGAPRTSRESLSCAFEGRNEKDNHTTCGIWLVASHINHSCISNCRRSFIGDMQIIRATRDLEAGTELRFPYHQHGTLDTYEAVQKRLSHWGFTCDCALCRDAQSTPGSVWKRRRALLKDFSAALKRPSSPALGRMKKVLAELDQTHPHPGGGGTGSEVSGTTRLEAWDPYLTLGLTLLARGRLLEAAGALIKALESLGFVIAASVPPPPKGEPSQQQQQQQQQPPPRFQVLTWGIAVDHVVIIFTRLSLAYQVLSPGLVDVVSQYARTAYRIAVGEDDTFDDMVRGMIERSF